MVFFSVRCAFGMLFIRYIYNSCPPAGPPTLRYQSFTPAAKSDRFLGFHQMYLSKRSVYYPSKATLDLLKKSEQHLNLHDVVNCSILKNNSPKPPSPTL